MVFDDVTIKKALLSGNYVKEKDMKAAEASAKSRRTSLVDLLLTEEYVSKDIIGQALAESARVPYADLNSNQPPKDQVVLFPEAFARKYRAVVFSAKKTGFVVATDQPESKELKAAAEEILKKKVAIAYSLPEDIDAVLSTYQKTLETRFSKIIESGKRIAPEILGTLFLDAVDLHASDIHFEPNPDGVLLRLRIDGVLRDAGQIPRDYYENILNRIKVQSGIRLDEHFAAQDGAMQFRHEALTVDMRVSVIPTVEGEKVVLRLLGSYVRGLHLGELGLSVANQKIVEECVAKPFGMILVSGPTGSGKTTTLYALLKTLNQSDVNITTIEDPVEYKMRGVNQIQVNPVTNLTFAKGLRSIVRQDPDIILVGEIRDEETAEIAVNAALTGHLLLSTFHANDAATAIPRLLDMGIEPFLLSSTFELAIAQRLARKICDQCRFSVTITQAQLLADHPNLKPHFPEKKVTLYQGKGCARCAQTGYIGRTAVFELIRMTPEIQDMVLKHPSSHELWEVARRQGSKSMFEDGIEKVRNGITTLDELLRVAEPPDVPV